MTPLTLCRSAALAALLAFTGCADTLDAITSHSRPVAAAGGETLPAAELAGIMADSPLPDSALTGYWAAQIGRLWADYVSIARLYEAPDTTESLDYDPLLEAARYYPAIAVQRYRDSVVLAGVEPTEEEVREYFDSAQPFTRLDVRRIRLEIPPAATDAALDSLSQEARRLRARIAGGTDFIEAAREFSQEPPAARGQVLTFQAHHDFPPAADSVVFALRPGEISPVITTDEEMVFYRIERRRTPEFDDVKKVVRQDMLDRRRGDRLAVAADSLLEDSRRAVADGAVRTARLVASDAGMGAGRVAGSLRLVRYEGGDFTVEELRQLFQARPDLMRRFADSDDEQIALDLYELAGDEVLIAAAAESGIGLPEEVRRELREGIGGQLAKIATRMGLSHRLVVNPAYDVGAESRRYLVAVLDQAAPVPWLTEFRGVLDQRHPSRVDDRSAAAAARQARDLRGLDDDAVEPDHPAQSDHGGTEPAEDAGEPAAPADEPAAHDATEDTH